MTTDQIRQAYLDFFASKGHAIIPGAPLVPENDPTVLFTTAGMHPLVPYLLGEKHPAGTRLANVQRCVRTGDIDEVGDNSHLTMFEMLGNWSLGDYFKEGAIEYSFEFITKILGIPLEKFAVTCFEGDADAPKDEESAAIWERLGVKRERIGFLPKAKNWWGPAGLTGPCGPDTEMFYWVGPSEFPPAGSNPATDDPNWLEIWNDVFMQYAKKEDPSTGSGQAPTFEPLKQQNVDTGMGLERVAAVLQGVASVYETDRMKPILEKVQEMSSHATAAYEDSHTEDFVIRQERIVVDHIKAATFMIADGVRPSNVDQGYVLRRLVRRAVRALRTLVIRYEGTPTLTIAMEVIEQFNQTYPMLAQQKEEIMAVLQKEEAQFAITLHDALRIFDKKTSVQMNDDNTFTIPILSGNEAFDLVTTYGMPLEMVKEEASDRLISLSPNFDQDFKYLFAEHQALSRAGAEQKFKGGLADNSAETTKLHTATHLLNAALHRVLGGHVSQKGSNITAERLRFDFNHQDKMTPEQIAEVDVLVNEAIKADLPVTFHLTDVEGAKAEGAIGVFDDRYGAEVKVYVMGKQDAKTAGTGKVGDGAVFSKEICGGPHVAHTGMLGSFKIQKEESSSAGVRRIKAVVTGGPTDIDIAVQSA